MYIYYTYVCINMIQINEKLLSLFHIIINLLISKCFLCKLPLWTQTQPADIVKCSLLMYLSLRANCSCWRGCVVRVWNELIDCIPSGTNKMPTVLMSWYFASLLWSVATSALSNVENTSKLNFEQSIQKIKYRIIQTPEKPTGSLGWWPENVTYSWGNRDLSKRDSPW